MPHRTTTLLERATPADVPTVSAVLARAFQNDPVFDWLMPDAGRRYLRLAPVFAAFTEAYLVHEETYIAADGVGAALWAPAGVEPLTEEQAETLGKQLSAIMDDDASRAVAVTELLDEHHPPQPCVYLQFMGVVPEHQGRGHGSRLLEPVLEACDANGTPAYLEATNMDNRRLYQRHGFETVQEIALPQGPPLWSMWREPLLST